MLIQSEPVCAFEDCPWGVFQITFFSSRFKYGGPRRAGT